MLWLWVSYLVVVVLSAGMVGVEKVLPDIFQQKETKQYEKGTMRCQKNQEEEEERGRKKTPITNHHVIRLRHLKKNAST